MHFTREQIEFYKTNGYVSGPKVLSDETIARLHRRIDDILNDRVPFPSHLKGETTTKSSAKGQLRSVKVGRRRLVPESAIVEFIQNLEGR